LAQLIFKENYMSKRSELITRAEKPRPSSTSVQLKHRLDSPIHILREHRTSQTITGIIRLPHHIVVVLLAVLVDMMLRQDLEARSTV
jgi:hypothetical protein